MFCCPRCGNADSQFIGYLNHKPYCRKCLMFPQKTNPYVARLPTTDNLELSYALTKEQRRVADALLERYYKHHNAFIHAVCGAGKTEIVYPLIDQALKDGKRIGFAIPRRDVVIELENRLKEVFPHRSVVSIYGGHKETIEADICVLTMHQLYAFPQFFDILIGDEVDAFPFEGDEVLETFFMRASREMVIMMSATPSSHMLAKIPSEDHLFLYKRFHGKAIPVPKIMVKSRIKQGLFILQKLRMYQKEKKPCLIFAPTIEQAETLFSFLRFFFPLGACVHSKKNNREMVLQKLKEKKLSYLVTTSILERGITVARLQVMIYHADSSFYQSDTLEQICGRVGRKKEAPDGDIYFIAEQKTEAMLTTIERIQNYNRDL